MLRPGGTFHFLEHGLCPDPAVAHKQHRFNGLQQRLCGGCHLDRPIDALVREAGFEVTELQHDQMPGPKFMLPVGLPLRGRGDADGGGVSSNGNGRERARRVGSTRTSVASGWAGCSRSRLLWEEIERDLQRESGFSFGHYEILVMLSEAPDRSRRMSELADATQSSRSRLSHAVARLEELGWVRRETCTTDRRGQLAVLTDEGFAALEAAAPGTSRACAGTSSTSCRPSSSPPSPTSRRRCSTTSSRWRTPAATCARRCSRKHVRNSNADRA